MDNELWIVTGIICAIVVVLMYVGDRVEARYHRMHPPDDYDGCREDKENEQP